MYDLSLLISPSPSSRLAAVWAGECVAVSGTVSLLSASLCQAGPATAGNTPSLPSLICLRRSQLTVVDQLRQRSLESFLTPSQGHFTFSPKLWWKLFLLLWRTQSRQHFFIFWRVRTHRQAKSTLMYCILHGIISSFVQRHWWYCSELCQRDTRGFGGGGEPWAEFRQRGLPWDDFGVPSTIRGHWRKLLNSPPLRH